MKSYGYARDNEQQQRGGFQNQNRPNQFQPMERGKEESKKSFFQKNSKTIVIASVAVAAVSTAALVKTLYDNAVSTKAVVRANALYENEQKQKDEPAVESEETKK